MFYSAVGLPISLGILLFGVPESGHALFRVRFVKVRDWGSLAEVSAANCFRAWTLPMQRPLNGIFSFQKIFFERNIWFSMVFY
jgi:hypothetical protein